MGFTVSEALQNVPNSTLNDDGSITFNGGVTLPAGDVPPPTGEMRNWLGAIIVALCEAIIDANSHNDASGEEP